MKLEKINDNQIKCVLSSHDLASRQLSLTELAYGSEKARRLFNEMIDEAGTELDFHTDNSPLMIEAIPMASEGLTLIITKVDNPEELDTRFAKFAPAIMAKYGSSPVAGDLPGAAHVSAEDVLKAFGKFIDMATREITSDNSDDASSAPGDMYKAFVYDDISQASAAARVIAGFFSSESSLYHRPDGVFYLVLHKGALEPEVFNKICNIMIEYGAQVRTGCTNESYYREHYEIVYDGDAVSELIK